MKFIKKSLSIIMSTLIVFNMFGCNDVSKEKDKIIDTSYNNLNKKDASIRIDPLYVFVIEDTFLVAIYKKDSIDKTVEFSSDRSISKTNRLIPQKIDDTTKFIGQKVADVEKCYGKFHVDIGSGFYIPAYITTDGYLIIFTVDNETITSTSKKDLLVK